jgi:hypothetical protein
LEYAEKENPEKTVKQLADQKTAMDQEQEAAKKTFQTAQRIMETVETGWAAAVTLWAACVHKNRVGGKSFQPPARCARRVLLQAAIFLTRLCT